MTKSAIANQTILENTKMTEKQTEKNTTTVTI